MRKFKLNSAVDSFSQAQLEAYLRGMAEDLLETFESDKAQVNVVAANVPGYNPDWCGEEVTPHDLENKKRLVNLMVQYATDMLLRNSEEYESR